MAEIRITDNILWEHIMNSDAMGVFWKDKDRRFIGANYKFMETYGIQDLSEILGKTDEEMHWNVDDTLFKKEEEEILSKGKRSVGIHGRTIIKGTVHEIIATKEPIYVDGEIVGIFGQFVDVGEIEHLAGKHEEGEEEQESALMNAVEMLETITELSKRWKESEENFVVARFTWEEYEDSMRRLGLDLTDQLIEEISKEFAASVRNVAFGAYIGGGIFVVASKRIDREENEALGRATLAAIRNLESLKKYGFSGAFSVEAVYAKDVEDLSRIFAFTKAPKDVRAKALYLQQLGARNVVTHLPAAVLIIAVTAEQESSILYMSEPIIRALGKSAEQCRDMESMLSFVYEEDKEKFWNAVKRSQNEKRGIDEFLRIRSEEGKVSWAHLVSEAVPQPDGGCIYFVVYTDVTERVELEYEKSRWIGERLNRYKNLVSNLDADSEKNLVLKIHIDGTLNKVINWWSSEDGYDIDESWNLFGFRDFILDHAFSDKDREVLWKNIDFDTIVRELEIQGYAIANVEYLRVNQKKEALWSRFEIRSIEDPESHHIHNYMYLFNVHRDYIPPVFLHQLASQEYEKAILLDIKQEMAQLYSFENGGTMESMDIREYAQMFRAYAKKNIVPEHFESFCQSMDIHNVVKELDKGSGSYHVGEWVTENGERRRKAWTFCYVYGQKTSILVARSDITSSYVDKDAYNAKIHEITSELEVMNKDVTGVLTRRRALAEMRALFEQRKEGKFALIMVDMDNLKFINDHFGHPSGDFAIKSIAEILLHCFRRTDIVGRIGGDEFMVLCENVGEEIVKTKVETILRMVNQVTVDESEELHLSCSIGYYNDDFKDNNFDKSYERVDTALYRAKNGGKSSAVEWRNSRA